MEKIVATAFSREHGGSDVSMLLRVRIIEELAPVTSCNYWEATTT